MFNIPAPAFCILRIRKALLEFPRVKTPTTMRNFLKSEFTILWRNRDFGCSEDAGCAFSFTNKMMRATAARPGIIESQKRVLNAFSAALTASAGRGSEGEVWTGR